MAWGGISLFGGFLENENSLETDCDFRKCFTKGFFLTESEVFRISVLTANSRYLQTAALNDWIQADHGPFTYGFTHLRKQYSYIWLPSQYHSISVI